MAFFEDFEAQRIKQIAKNRAHLRDTRLTELALTVTSMAQVKQVVPAPPAQGPKRTIRKRPQAPATTRQTRAKGSVVHYEIDERDRPVGIAPKDLLAATGQPPEAESFIDITHRGQIIVPDKPNEEQLKAIEEVRCSNKGRGTVYDRSAGVTCHFCRQKKLCGDDDCPRCQKRDETKECTGKSFCSRCMSATGRFCRACLVIRYGITLEEIKAQQESGEWLCPHCYEDEHPDEGWICNSSICMRNRGFAPTGIAIYNAMDQGFKSVAHLLQHNLAKAGGLSKVLEQGIEEENEEASAAAAPTETSTEDVPLKARATRLRSSARAGAKKQTVEDEPKDTVASTRAKAAAKRAIAGPGARRSSRIKSSV